MKKNWHLKQLVIALRLEREVQKSVITAELDGLKESI